MVTSTNCQLGKDISDDIGCQIWPVVVTGRVISRGRALAGVGVVPGPSGFGNGARQAARPGHCMVRSQPSSTGGPEAEAGSVAWPREAGRRSFFLLGQRVTRSRPMRLGGAVTTRNPDTRSHGGGRPARGGRAAGVSGGDEDRRLGGTGTTQTGQDIAHSQADTTGQSDEHRLAARQRQTANEACSDENKSSPGADSTCVILKSALAPWAGPTDGLASVMKKRLGTRIGSRAGASRQGQGHRGQAGDESECKTGTCLLAPAS